MAKFYLTTPIFYVNSHPHLGHVYSALIADTIARLKKQRGIDTFFLTGTDEHGLNIERAAAAKGIGIDQHVQTFVDEFKEVFQTFNVNPRHWIRTTDSYHERGASELWKRVRDNGFIYKGPYEGWYCAGENSFLSEDEWIEGPDGIPVCKIHERPLERVAEESYFFKLSEFQEKLLAWYEAHPEFIQPEARRNEVISFVRGGLNDLSISRVSVKWGLPVPDDPKHTMYVWFDALSNYITAVGFGNEETGGEKQFSKYWPADLHIVGKDILRFHAVYWPAFLMAGGVPLPQTVYAHGLLLSDGRKMSKTLGNVIDLHKLRENFAPDVVRYFCLREVVFGQDGDFTFEALIDRTNGDLSAGLGNLSSRILTMIRNYCDGVVPRSGSTVNSSVATRANEVRSAIDAARTDFDREFNTYNFSRGLESVWSAITSVDKFISEFRPWDLAKDAVRREELTEVLETSARALRAITALLAPALPEACQEIWKQLGERGDVLSVNPHELSWTSNPGGKIGEVRGVFPRLDKKKVMEDIKNDKPLMADAITAELPPPPAALPGVAYIGIEDFAKVELRAGEILTAERVPKADKLLRFTVDVGEPSPRQILAGIAQYYDPEKLPGRKVIIVTNLAPRKLRGFESQGMVLAAAIGDEGRPVLAGFLEDVPNGSRLK